MLLTLSSVANGSALHIETHSEPSDQRHLTMSPSSSATGIRRAVSHPYCTLENQRTKKKWYIQLSCLHLQYTYFFNKCLFNKEGYIHISRIAFR